MNKTSAATNYFNKRHSNQTKLKTSKTSNNMSNRPTLTFEAIQAHLLKSQASLLEQLQNRLKEKQQMKEE